MTTQHVIIFIIALLTLFCCSALAEERFPPPDFETGYTMPDTEIPPPKNIRTEYIAISLLFVTMSISAYLALKKRNRKMIFSLMIFSMLYFGFFRKGCICPIGSIGNVALSAFSNDYAIPLIGLAFFLLPLIFTMFFGRVFCSAVCPLGAIQDLVLLKPLSVPRWLESALRIFAYLYLALAVLFAATGTAFIICRYDPFIAIFRLGGNLNIVILGICMLLIGVFVGRPYCRFLCPYSVILRQFSRISRKRVSITPNDCIKCKLCEDACPFGAIDKPTQPWPDGSYIKDKKLLALLIVIAPVLIFISGWLLSSASAPLSRSHPTVDLARRIYLEENNTFTDTTDASDAFRATGKTISTLYSDASAVKEQFSLGGWFAGAFVGLIIAAKLIRSTIRWRRTEYLANPASCLACGRCFLYCPKEHERLKKKNTGNIDVK